MKSHKLEILTAAKDVLDSTDMNTSGISDGIIRGGLSSLLGKKYSVQETNKPGQEGLDRDFCAPEYHVSNQTQSLMDFIYGTLDQIGSSALAKNCELLYTAKDLFDMYRAFAFDNDLPKLISYNDSRYVAFHLNILGQQYAEVIRSCTGNASSFLDLVPLTYAVGHELYEEELVFYFD
jgi:hypothetical protein